MKRLLANSFLLPSVLVACAGVAPPKPGDPVKVFGADPTRLSTSSPELDGCRLLEMTKPVLEEESDRAFDDPYRKQREAARALGGNVLLVFSDVLIRRPSNDCSPRDTSPGCLETSQTWYKTSFGYYSCLAEAAARLEAEARTATVPGPIFSWSFPKRSPTALAPASSVAAPASPPAASPAAPPVASAPAPPPAPPAPPPAEAPSSAAQLKAKVLSMMEAGVGVDLIATWVANQATRPALSADDVIAWKKSGIDEKIIQAALNR